MANPLDYFLSVAKANGQLAFRLGEATRAGFADLAQTGSEAAAAVADQAKAVQSGNGAPASSEALSTFLGGLEKNRQASLDRFTGAVEEWQSACRKAARRAADAVGDDGAWPALFAPFLNKPETPKSAAKA